MPSSIPGIHHVTAITADVQRCADFYVGALGLRFVKQTVNFDVPDTYHLYFGDEVGTPGTAITFFGWPHLPWGPAGTGQVATIGFAVPPASLGYWDDRLRRLGIEVRRAERGLVLADPDGIHLELLGETGGGTWRPALDTDVPDANQVRGFHSVGLAVAEAEPTALFLVARLGFRETERRAERVRLETGGGGAGSIVDLLVSPSLPRGREATGTVHHVALRALDDAHQLAWRETLAAAGVAVTPVIDRKYFHSIYFREPGGVLFEIATDGPGFTVDEPVERLGRALQLPDWREAARGELLARLPAISPPR